jgi:hypothetical protein
MARHSAALRTVEPLETGVVDDPRQADIEAAVAGVREHDAAPASDVPAADVVPTPAKRGRKPRAVVADAITKLVPAPVPVGTVPTPPMSVAAALAMIEPGTEMTILGATWGDVNAAADELGIRAYIFTRQTEHGVDVDHRSHGFDAVREIASIITSDSE